MDYEKKFRERLETAKYWHNASEGGVQAVLEEIFPELKMTEDEQTRDWLVDFLMDNAEKLLNNDGGGYDPNVVRKFQIATDWLKGLDLSINNQTTKQL